MTGEAALATDHIVISYLCASRNACLCGENIVFTDRDVVRHLNKVVEFRAASHGGLAEGSPVHGGVGSNLHIILYHHDSGLRYLLVMTVFRRETESVRTDHST